MRLTLLVSIAALAAACSSAGEPAQPSLTQSNTTDPTEPPVDDDTSTTKEAGVDEPDPAEPKTPTKDAGAGDATAPTKDAGPTGPTAFTKTELQTLVDDRCSPCHIDFASGGMSLANDFTTNTVGVASTELPSMKRILKGDHTKSYLWHKVNGSHLTVGGSGVRMPKNGTAFTATELDRLAKYIDGL
jgi:hypothetical protein